MASSPKLVYLLFLLTSLLFSVHTYARDSQFFSKVSRNRDIATTTTTPTKENAFDEPLNKEEDQPTFIPQTTETGYGLYGHETGVDPPSTTTGTTTTSLYNMDENNNNNNNNNNKYENFNNFYKNNNENHEKNYVPQLNGLYGTSYTNEPSKYINNNNNYNNNNNNNGEGKYYGLGYNGVAEKQGMSDTRFLENGKYYYDLNEEKKNELNTNYMSHSNNYNNNYNTNGYYGNQERNYEQYYSNNRNNKFYNGNGMQGYQNQEAEELFDFDQP